MKQGGGGGGGGGNGGGFTGYRRFPLPNSGGSVGVGFAGGIQSNGSWDHHGNKVAVEYTVREQDRFMPIANVIRIMRKILPAHAKISDNAKETIQECVSEFISFITGEANDRCQREQRKTITAEDVLWAMSKLGFDDYIEPLTLFLHRNRECDGGDRRSAPVRDHRQHSAPASAAYGMMPPHFHFAQHHHGHGQLGFFAVPMNNGTFVNKDASSIAGGGGSASQQVVTHGFDE